MQAIKVHYRGWDNCYRLTNSKVDLIVTADVGPRIIRFGFIGQANEFKELASDVGKTGGEKWRIYGGHRLWHAPEAMPRSYVPDNNPVEVVARMNSLHMVQAVEPLTGIQKELEITLDEYTAHARIVHCLSNLGPWPVELAVWCLTALDPGGTAIFPLPPRAPHSDEHLVPASSLALWSYTDLSDPRLVLGKRFILLRQDPDIREPQKIGLSVLDGWVAYARADHLFVKKFIYQPGAVYPDMGSSCESWTNHEFLELETLSPLTLLKPGEKTEYAEDWYLLEGVPQPANEKDVIANVLPAIDRIV